MINIINKLFIISLLLSIIASAIFLMVMPIKWYLLEDFTCGIIVILIMYFILRRAIKKPLKLVYTVAPTNALLDSMREKYHPKSKESKCITPRELAFRYFCTDKKRTLLIISSLVLSTTIMMIVLIVINSINPVSLAKQNYLYGSNIIVSLKPSISENNIINYNNVIKEGHLNSQLAKSIQNKQGVSLHRSKMLEAVINDNKKSEIIVQNIINSETVGNKVLNKINQTKSAANTIPIVINVGAYWYENGEQKYKVGDEFDITVKSKLPKQIYTAKVVDSINKPNDLVVYYSKSKDIDRILNTNSDNIWYINAKDINSMAEIIKLFKDNKYLTVNLLKEDINMYKEYFANLMAIVFGIGILILCFSLVNLFDLCISNIFSREHSYRILRIIGMTKKQINTIISIENSLYFILMALISILIATPLGYLICKKIASYFRATYTLFTFPTKWLLLYLLFVLITSIAMERLYKNIITKRFTFSNNIKDAMDRLQ